MKLMITRDQAKGMFGGVKFQLDAKAELTSEEAAIVKKYKADKEVLVRKEVKIPLTDKVISLAITIDSLIAGQTFKCNDITEILETEKNVKEACETFKKYIMVMNHFGGQEVIEF